MTAINAITHNTELSEARWHDFYIQHSKEPISSSESHHYQNKQRWVDFLPDAEYQGPTAKVAVTHSFPYQDEELPMMFYILVPGIMFLSPHYSWLCHPCWQWKGMRTISMGSTWPISKIFLRWRTASPQFVLIRLIGCPLTLRTIYSD